MGCEGPGSYSKPSPVHRPSLSLTRMVMGFRLEFQAASQELVVKRPRVWILEHS